MDVHAARGDGRMLRRVIALLVALAVLTERVAGRSAPVRFFVLWILRRAETVASEYVFEEAGIPPAARERSAAVGNDPEHALCLAARFHALADMLRALLPVFCPFGRRPARSGFAFGPVTPSSGLHPGGWTQQPYDTS